ncbi:MAG: M20/M25/M40 family metallo-hydrolase [Bacteroidales bacterium]|nr:MAG: M20/M25/M40 family metallo-hydrolase [Bacteroidales bacterium]
MRFTVSVLLLMWFNPLYLYSQKTVDNGLNTIKSEDIVQTIGYLSSSRFKGRLPGTAEYDQAARYVATRLKNAGVKPINQPSMLQYFNEEVNIIKKAQLLLMDNNGRAFHFFKLGEDFTCRGFTGAGVIKGEVVFAGFGIKNDEYNDYRSIDVKDKIVMVFKTAPSWKAKNGSWGDISPRAKARIAKDLGAKALIIIGEPKMFPNTMIYGSTACGNLPHILDFPMLQASTSVTDSIFAELPMKPLEYYELINKDKAPHSIETGKWLMINVETDYIPEKQTANVVGFIEGSDPKLKSEFVVLGAHLDHVGFQTESLFFPGADDNASGVATLIAIAEAIKKSEVKLKRSVIFVAFSSEENGLKGSKYFVANSPIDLSKTVAMMNFDCVGQGDSIAIGGKWSYPKLWKKAKQFDKKHTKLLSRKTFGGGGADAEAFYKVGISTLYFNTSGGYKYLHQTTDKAETINKELVEKIARLGFLMTVELANGKYKGEKDRLKK